MTFLAPWALALGIAGAAGAVLLHLVARQRPAAYLLPTARFIPDRQAIVSRAATRPTDLLLLLLRVLLLLSAGVAFARPVLRGRPAPRARLVLLDRSALVADPAAAWQRARAIGADGVPSVLITFDSSAAVVADAAARDSSLPVTAVAPPRAGSITAALVAARRAAEALAARADSVELVLLSPLAVEELDAATGAARALWPGAIRLERLAMRSDSLSTPTLERALSLDDVLGPAVAAWPVRATPRAVRLRRAGAADSRDSAFAVAGGTVVVWDSAAAPFGAEGLMRGDDVVVATLGRRSLLGSGTAAARWADGTPAAQESPLGAGCLRTVGVAVPAAGDLPLRPAFQRLARAMLAPCSPPATGRPADSAVVASLAGGTAAVSARALAGRAVAPSPIVPWLLGAALVCALGELALRGRSAWWRGEAA